MKYTLSLRCTNWLILIFTLICFINCSNDNDVIIFDNFPINQDLGSNRIDWINHYCPVNAAIYDSILLIVDIYKKHFLHFYNLNTHQLIGSLGGLGKGPDEFIDPPWIYQDFEGSNNEIFFYLTDQSKRIMLKVNLFASISTNRIVSERIFKIPNTCPTPIPTLLNDSTFVGTNNDDKGSLFLYWIQRDSVIKWETRVKLKGSIPSDYYQRITDEFIEVSPNKQIIIGTFNRLKTIHIYNNKGDLIYILKDNNQPRLDFSVTTTSRFYSNNLCYYVKSLVSNSHFIIINVRSDFKEKLPNTQILVFDISGQAIAEYNLDKYLYPYSITMDWKKQQLYGYDEFREEFVYYNIECLKKSY